MSPDEKNLSKRYYAMREVAEMFGVNTSLIRFWEKEFDFLRPYKTGKGERRFTKENINQLRVIHSLVKERGFTIKGANKEIKERKTFLLQKQQNLSRLKEIRNFLVKLKEEV